MNVARDIELDHLLVERIPEAIAERRRLDAAALTRIRIEQTSDEALLLHALLEIGNNRFRADARRQRQPADTAEGIRIQLDLPGDDVVRLFDEPLHQLRRLAGHHLIWPR